MFCLKFYDFYYKLRTLPFIDEIWLCGSRSQGSETERSDVDLAIFCPRATFQKAYALQLIHHEFIWLEMMESRNLTSHAYKQPTAFAIYESCKRYLPVFEETYKTIQGKYDL